MYIIHLPDTVSHFISYVFPSISSYVPVFQQALFLFIFQGLNLFIQICADFDFLIPKIYNLLIQRIQSRNIFFIMAMNIHLLLYHLDFFISFSNGSINGNQIFQLISCIISHYPAHLSLTLLNVFSVD